MRSSFSRSIWTNRRTSADLVSSARLAMRSSACISSSVTRIVKNLPFMFCLHIGLPPWAMIGEPFRYSSRLLPSARLRTGSAQAPAQSSANFMAVFSSSSPLCPANSSLFQ